MFERLVSFQAAKSPDDAAIVLSNEIISYRLLKHLVDGASAALSEQIKPGERVLIEANNLALHWVLTLAVEGLGAVSTALPGMHASDQFLKYMRADRYISEQPLDFETDTPHIRVDQAWLTAIGQERRSGPPLVRAADDPVRIVVTSGTTGTNRKIMLTRRMLDMRVSHAILSQVFAGAKPRVISEIGPASIAGLMMGLAAWSIGGATCQRDPRVSWADTFAQMDIDAVVLAPIQLQMLLAGLPDGFEAKPGLVVFVAGGSLSRQLADLARAKLTSNIVLGYGATETGGVTQGHIDLLEGAEDSAGFVQPWAEVEIVDAQGTPQPPNTIGEIRIRGDEVVESYLDEPGSPDRATFRDGWFYPRDLGYVTSRGMMKVMGRLDDLLHLGGDKQLPSRIEGWALAVPGVADAAAFALPDEAGVDEPWLAYVSSGELAVDALEQRLLAEQGRPVRVIEVASIPRNALGKIVRQQLRNSVSTTLQAAADRTS